MKHIKTFSTLLSITTITVLLSMSLPEAMAMNSPAFGGGTVAVGTDVSFVITADTLGGSFPHFGREITVVDVVASSYTDPVSSSCDPMAFTGGPPFFPAGATVWELRDMTGLLRIGYDISAGGQTISYTWGPNGGLLTTVTPAGGAEVYIENVAAYAATGPLLSSGAGFTGQGVGVQVPALWVNVNGGPAPLPSTSTVGVFKGHTCGDEFGGATAYNAPGPYAVVVPVGGEIQSINTTALLIAGLGMNAVWLVPAFGTIAAAGFAVYKMRKHN